MPLTRASSEAGQPPPLLPRQNRPSPKPRSRKLPPLRPPKLLLLRPRKSRKLLHRSRKHPPPTLSKAHKIFALSPGGAGLGATETRWDRGSRSRGSRSELRSEGRRGGEVRRPRL